MVNIAPTRVLIVEDEPALADVMRYGLEREGFPCSVAADGTDAARRFREERPGLVVLDLMLPGISGEDLCRMIRAHGRTPIVIVSAKTSELDRVVGLELGADDYLTKPFSTRELVARVRSVLRRAQPAPPAEQSDPVLTVGRLVLDPDRHEAWLDGDELSLPPKEFDLLATLMRRAGRLCTRDMLIADIWGPDYFGDTRTLDVHVKRLRQKLERDPRRPELLVTVRGLGYKIAPPDRP